MSHNNWVVGDPDNVVVNVQESSVPLAYSALVGDIACAPLYSLDGAASHHLRQLCSVPDNNIRHRSVDVSAAASDWVPQKVFP